MVGMRRFSVDIESDLLNTWNREPFGFYGHGGMPLNPLSRKNLFKSVISREPPDIANLGSSTVFNSKFMLFQGCSQPVTAQEGFCAPSTVEPGHFGPIWDFSNLCFWLPHWPDWDFLELHCSLRLFLPNPPSFPLSIHKWQNSIVIQSLFLPTIHTNLFPPIHFLLF